MAARYNVSGNVLNEEDLAEIMHFLGNSETKWKEIGMALGLKENTLNRIEHENHDLMSRLRKMVLEWLKKNYNTEKFGEPTWEKLVAAVRSRVGGNNSALAQEIARGHGIHFEEIRARTSIDDHKSIWFYCCCCCFRTDRSHYDHDYDFMFSDSSSFRRRVDSKSSAASQPITQAISDWKLEDIRHLSYYHGVVTGLEAQYLLRRHGGHCFLIRYSERKRAFVISVLRDNTRTASHFKLKIAKGNDCNMYEIEGSEKSFEKINELLDYFKINPIPPTITTIGDPCADKQRVETTL